MTELALIAQHLDDVGCLNDSISFTVDLPIGGYSIGMRWIDVRTKNGLFEITKLDWFDDINIRVAKLHDDTYSLSEIDKTILNIGDPDFFLKLDQHIGLK